MAIVRSINSFFAELVSRNLVNIIRYAGLCDQCHRFSPGKRGAFPLVEKWRFVPYRNAYRRCSVSPSARASLLCMSAQYAHPFSCEERSLINSSRGFFKATVVYVSLYPKHRRQNAWGKMVVIDSLHHSSFNRRCNTLPPSHAEN